MFFNYMSARRSADAAAAPAAHAAPVESGPAYLAESAEALDDFIRDLAHVRDYMARINPNLIPRYRMNSALLEEFAAELRRFKSKAPTNAREWATQWMDHIESFTVKNSNRGKCLICMTDDCELIPFNCACKSHTMCLSCTLHTWYNLTDGLMRSFMTCPFCKNKLEFSDILNAIDFVWVGGARR